MTLAGSTLFFGGEALAASNVRAASLASLIREDARFALAMASALGCAAARGLEATFSFVAVAGLEAVYALFGTADAGLATGAAFTGPAL